MARAYWLLALVAFVLLGAQLAAGSRVLLDDDDGDDCDDIRSMAACMNKATCAWCSGNNRARCVSGVAARSVAYLEAGTCSGRGVNTNARNRCGAIKSANACVDADDLDCAWCGGAVSPARCLPEDAARFLPTAARDCKFDDDDDDDDDDRDDDRDDDDDDDDDDRK